jgi:hypothetical protein
MDSRSMSAGDYHQFVNRHLPMIERGCTSKALFQPPRGAEPGPQWSAI